ncbi:MAG: hypothetical protein GX868_09160 [Actinobacteria bacterium]|nr:hypothetical protein [Actinomycetota bacterium]
MNNSIQPQQIREYLDDEAERNLRRYFGDDPEDFFIGGTFERFAGGGDRPEVANRLTAEDIVAVSMLGVQVPGETAREILVLRDGEFSELLSLIPVDIDMWQDEAEAALVPGSAAAELSERLSAIEGAGWVTAAKLLARKRPRLIPVNDRVVRKAFRDSEEFDWWAALRGVLVADPSLVEEVKALRAKAGLGEGISVLRVIDVAVWMKDHPRRRLRTKTGH